MLKPPSRADTGFDSHFPVFNAIHRKIWYVAKYASTPMMDDKLTPHYYPMLPLMHIIFQHMQNNHDFIRWIIF